MQKIIANSQWVPSDEIELEENAKLAVNLAENVLVVAGPGAGKTELLAQKAGYLFQTNTCKYPQKILAISFKKDAAANLKERVEVRFNKEYGNRFSSLTYDAFAKKILDQFRNALPKGLKPNKDYVIGDNKIIAEAFRKSGYIDIGDMSPGKFVANCDMKLSKVNLPLSGDDIEIKAWRLLIKGFNDYPSCLTFKMISMLAAYILTTNPHLLKCLHLTYSYVFLDEFQDTTDLQYNLMKICFYNSNSKITAVGDNKQRIMLWAGARKSVFDDFQSDFSAKKIQLLMNHRSAPRIVDLQKLMYDSLQEDFVELQTSKKWEDNDGDIKLYISEDEEKETKYLVADIKAKLSNGIPANDICILVKQLPGNYTKKLSEELANIGIKARIETEYQDLLKEFIVKLVLNTLKVSIVRESPIEREYINNVLEEIRGLELDDNHEKYYREQKKLVKMLDIIAKTLTADGSKEVFQELINNIIQFFGRSEIETLYPTYGQRDFFDSMVQKMVDLLWQEFKETGNWSLAIDNFYGLNSIPIMTIHKSKGLEYEAVYFVGLEDGAFWNFKNQPEEDRCAFFVALSRAKQYLVFSYCAFRSKLRYPNQRHDNINEFFELLKSPDISTVIECE